MCQISGKRGQDPQKACLRHIPIVEERFAKVIVDCVGPPPRSKKGFEYLLTIMCVTTRFVEAVPLRSITAKSMIDALLKFFTTFGLPQEVQTDQGTNFLAKVFNDAMRDLGIKHTVSSAYHPQSQGVLERFHRTLKELLRCYCIGEPHDWPSGVPFVLFAIRDAVHESLGFTPFELVFGHEVRGPMKLVKETWMKEKRKAAVDVLSFMTELKERLTRAVACAKEHLGEARRRMKVWYIRKARE